MYFFLSNKRLLMDSFCLKSNWQELWRYYATLKNWLGIVVILVVRKLKDLGTDKKENFILFYSIQCCRVWS